MNRRLQNERAITPSELSWTRLDEIFRIAVLKYRLKSNFVWLLEETSSENIRRPARVAVAIRGVFETCFSPR